MSRILEALKSREWEGRRFRQRGPDVTIACCPTCGNCETEGHTSDCTYAAAIREAERLPKRLTVDQIVKVVASACQELGDKHRKNIAEAVQNAIYGGEEPGHE